MYRDKYRCEFPKGVSPDSAYALCAREVFGLSITLARNHFGYEDPLNFIFESGHRNSSNAVEVFNAMKEHAEEGHRYGFFSLADKKRTRPLQAADHLPYLGRRNEAEALREGGIRDIREFTSTRLRDPGAPELKCPIFYFSIDETMLEFHRQQALVLRVKRRRLRSSQKADG